MGQGEEMKKLILGLSLVLGFQASAKLVSPLMKKVILEYEEVPTFSKSNIETRHLTVNRAGLAVASIEKNGKSKVVNVDILPRTQVAEYRELIEGARKGEIVSQSPRIFCFAAPVKFNEYTADAGSVMLRTGDPCLGRITYNQSEEASELIRALDDLVAKAFRN